MDAIHDPTMEGKASIKPLESSFVSINVGAGSQGLVVREWSKDFKGIPQTCKINSTKAAYKWRITFFGCKGRVLPDIRPLILILINMSIWLCVSIYYPSWTTTMNIGYGAISGLSFVMALLVSFRLHGAYDRWYEGRQNWADINRITRDLCQIIFNYALKCKDKSEKGVLGQNIAALLIAFPIILKNYLREESKLKDRKELSYFIKQELVDEIVDMNLPQIYHWQYCLEMLRANISLAMERGIIPNDGSWVLLIEEKLSGLSLAAGACDRIKTTPLAYGYAIHIRTVLISYFFFLPPLLISNGTTIGAHIIIILVLSHALLTVDQLAVQVEMPFGYDKLDLPLEDYCNTVANQIQLLMYTNTYKAVRQKFLKSVGEHPSTIVAAAV